MSQEDVDNGGPRSDGPALIVMPFPLKGLMVESAIYDQPERTTIDAQNVVISDPNGFARGAQRPGTSTVWGIPRGTGTDSDSMNTGETGPEDEEE